MRRLHLTILDDNSMEVGPPDANVLFAAGHAVRRGCRPVLWEQPAGWQRRLEWV